MTTTYLQAIEAQMGDWTYYITKMKFGEVCERVRLAEELHPSPELDDVIQRELTQRVEEMRDFLILNPQRFYGAIVVAIYGGNPKFFPVRIDEGNDIIDSVENSFGLLTLDGSQQYFALDGQHRVESIKAACREKSELLSDEISVIILQHENTPDGLQRTRRLFTKLNRYAKPTSKKSDITIDEDDVVAIITRRMIRENANFYRRVRISIGENLNPRHKKDDAYFTTLPTLYWCNNELIKAFDKKIDIDAAFKSIRPSDELIDGMYDYLNSIWNLLFQEVDQLKQIADGVYQPGTLRKTPKGGDVWGRPIFQKIVSLILKRGLAHDQNSLPSIVTKLNQLPANLNEEPWLNTLYDAGQDKLVRQEKGTINFLVDLICQLGEIAPVTKSKETLKTEYQAKFNDEKKDLPKLY